MQEQSSLAAGAGVSDTIPLFPAKESADPVEPLATDLETDFGPWLLISRRRVQSRSIDGGRYFYYSRKANYFHNFVNSNNLFDLNFSGSPFT